MTEWQPIETAPKDGTMILCWMKRIGVNSHLSYQLVSFYDGMWREPAQGLGLRRDPDFWMPLPPAPESN